MNAAILGTFAIWEFESDPNYLTPITLVVVMRTAGNDVEICIVNGVDQPMGFVYASRPVAGQVAKQWLGLADT